MYDAVGYVGVGVAVALETIIAPIPSEVILPMAGWKVSQSVADASVVEPLTGLPWNIPLAVALATVGSVVGALVGYAIGALGGRPILDRFGRYVGIGAADLDMADRWFARWGSWAVFLGRMVPLVRTFVSYPAGISRMPLGRFLLFSTLGSLPWNLALIYAGFVVGENYPEISATMKPFEY
ncbi:MAG: DedA family protein, partial [Candidatus Limnocylindria bacterium]